VTRIDAGSSAYADQMAVANGNTGRAKPNSLTWITFERAYEGTWTAIAKTDEGEIAATGATDWEARLALHEMLRKLTLSPPTSPSLQGSR
jgi:hypothetical protein